VNLPPDREEHLVVREPHVPGQIRDLVDARIEVDQHPPREPRQQRLLGGTAQVPEDVRAPHDLVEALLGGVTDVESLDVVIGARAVMEQHDHALGEVELLHPAEQCGHHAVVGGSVPAGREQVDPEHLMAEVAQAQQVLEAVPPVTAALQILGERTRDHDPGAGRGPVPGQALDGRSISP